jgi:hypothetical protein
MSVGEKFGSMLIAIAVFGVVFIGVLVIASRFGGRRGDKVQAASCERRSFAAATICIALVIFCVACRLVILPRSSLMVAMGSLGAPEP